MGAYINVKQANSAGIGIKPWIPMNRWGRDHFSLVLSFIGSATASVEGTLKKLNQASDSTDLAAGPPVAGDVFTITNATDLTSDVALVIVDTPLEAIRINQTAGVGSVDLHVMQQGD